MKEEKGAIMGALSKLIPPNGEGNPDTEFSLVVSGKPRRFFGPVMTSRVRPGISHQGTRQWIEQIFVSDDPDKDLAFKAAFKQAQTDLQVVDPWSLMGSSTCGRTATVRVIDHKTGAKTDHSVQVTRMEADTMHPIGKRPRIISAIAWSTVGDMNPDERHDYNTTARIVCALEHVPFDEL